ncbi:MAG: PQQ-binding-like beta-propeller repeat protein, partial [Thaumarchaeota archaeon]|nr:PQQ-binding-like beta-propeller repeat protein [Nitrososphaerota archaeon]
MPTALAASNSSSAAPAATPLSAIQANWAAADGNAFNQNFNPQTQINSSSAQYLGLNWLFPLPTHPTALLSVAGGLGVDTAPIIVNGTVYAITQYGQVFALNAANGNVLWTDVLPITANSTAGVPSAGVLTLHLHDGAEQYTTKLFGNTPTLWYAAPDLKIYAINALNGKYELNFSYFTGANTVSGNAPGAIYGPIAPNVLVDQQRGIMITSIGSPTSSATGRCFYRGWNVLVNPPSLMWTAYCSPPQIGGNIPVDPNYDIKLVNNMTGAEIFYPGPSANGGGSIPGTGMVNLKTLSAAQLNSTLYNDWGYAPQTAACTTADGGANPGSTAAGWGAPWLVDVKTGVAFLNTNNKDPYASACNPGPDLWAAAILAINDTTGKWIWGFQTTAHDIWDYDCSWQQVLGNETINGANTEVIWKTCKNGYLYELNASNGNMIWAWTPPQNILARCPYCFMLNPMNQTQMSQQFFNPSLADTLMYPPATGGFENEFAYNPTLNYLFTASQNVPAFEHYIPMNLTNYGKTSGFSGIAIAATAKNLDNATIEAVNAVTGQMVWSHFIATQGYRGGLTTSGNLVFVTLSSGDLQMLNAQTGALVKDVFIGGPLNELATIGATSSGQEEIIFPITAGLVTWGTGVPGD